MPESSARPSVEKYIKELRQALKCNGAHSFYFPPNKDLRRKMNLRLAREIGWGLQNCDADDILGSLYSQLIVANSLDMTGVCIDNKDFLTELRRKMNYNSDSS